MQCKPPTFHQQILHACLSYSPPELPQERIPERGQLSLQAMRAIAIPASPRLRSVLVPALPAVVRILHLHQFEVLLPIGPLLFQGSRTVADLNPAGSTVRAKPGFLHVSQILAACYGASAQCSVFNRPEKKLLSAWPDTCAH